MKAFLFYKPINEIPVITVPGSKSESNRLLILKGIFSNVTIYNLSNSDDTICLQNGIEKIEGTVDIHHAGTAMRFLTAFFASRNGVEVVLTGSERMQERPIKVLVDALKYLGAEIDYLKNDGYPPIKIIGKELKVNSVTLKANISSQFISALMLIAPSLKNGLAINLIGEITSVPYIEMTLNLLRKVGIHGTFSNNKIEINPALNISNCVINVESDWSSVSYYYSLVALSDNLEVILKNYTESSIQGDSIVKAIYEKLGVETTFNKKENSIQLKKNNSKINNPLILNLNDTPDIAQTIAVTCFGLGISCQLFGLKTLKIKETDRLLALKTELEKLGATVTITNDSLDLVSVKNINKNVIIETYQDHRMAMAFAPLVFKTPLIINEPNVVSKSYKSFWEDIRKTGIIVEIK